MKQEDKIKCIVSDNGTIIPINTIAAISGKNCIHHIWTNRDQDHEGYRLSDEQYNVLIKELKILSNDPDEENEDEKVRNKLIEFFKGYYPDKEWWGNITQRDILAWLEKYGEKAKYHDICDKCVRQPTCQSDCFLQQGEQKSFWSEEDKMQLDAAIHLVSSTGHIETANWLKDLKDRVQPQPKQQWSEEDIAMSNFIALILKKHKSDEDFSTFETTFKDCIDWLKSLKEKIQSQPKHEWSEEDKVIRNALIKFVELLYSYGSGIYDLDKNQFLDWLQKLENRIVSK